VIDPAKVTRTALENAASIASLLLTTEALICGCGRAGRIGRTNGQATAEAGTSARWRARGRGSIRRSPICEHRLNWAEARERASRFPNRATDHRTPYSTPQPNRAVRGCPVGPKPRWVLMRATVGDLHQRLPALQIHRFQKGGSRNAIETASAGSFNPSVQSSAPPLLPVPLAVPVGAWHRTVISE